MSQYHNLGTAEFRAAVRHREFLAEAALDRLAAQSARPPFLAGAVRAAVARVPTLRSRRASVAAPASTAAA